MATIDMADHIRIGFKHDIGANQSGAWNRGTARVNGRLDSIFARPRHHLARGSVARAGSVFGD